MSRLCLILNPEAGSAGDADDVVEELRGAGPLEVLRTAGPGDAEELARQALDAGLGRIAVAGGDGTLNEVLNGLAPRLAEAQLAVIPVGTGNDLARCPGIPSDVPRALEAIRRWRTRPLDVGRARGEEATRHFLNAVTGGFSTRVTEELETRDKMAWGALAYAVSAARALPDLQAHRTRVEIDDEQIDRPCLNLTVANGRHVGGGLAVAPRARLDDGLLDVVLVPEMPLPKLALVVSRLLAGDPAEDPDLVFRRARRLRVVADPPIHLGTDGEPALPTPATLEALPGALEVVVDEAGG